jgi:hypothetical protein
MIELRSGNTGRRAAPNRPGTARRRRDSRLGSACSQGRCFQIEKDSPLVDRTRVTMDTTRQTLGRACLGPWIATAVAMLPPVQPPPTAMHAPFRQTELVTFVVADRRVVIGREIHRINRGSSEFPAAHSSCILTRAMRNDCPMCGGGGWVCDEHSAHPWPHEECEAGKPCVCNPLGELSETYVPVQRSTERTDRITKRAESNSSRVPHSSRQNSRSVQVARHLPQLAWRTVRPGSASYCSPI